jgi:hypothetical protein
MHSWRTGSHNHTIQVVFGDAFPDELLSRVGAHVLVIDREDDIRVILHPFDDFLNIYRASDIMPTMTNKYTNSTHFYLALCHRTQAASPTVAVSKAR